LVLVLTINKKLKGIAKKYFFLLLLLKFFFILHKVNNSQKKREIYEKSYFLPIILNIGNAYLFTTWEFMHKDSFLPIAPFTGGHENLEANSMVIKNDSIIISRSRYDNLIIIYNQKTKEWTHLTNSDIYNKIYEESEMSEYDLEYIYSADFDNNGNLWQN
jgi:hypothetical protein